ncbi:16S rRNA (guanine(527)-N(7))-methyltransferase RsmG [Fodinibius sp.]|uniref:16S rRNA (guanine(527)-N(7))-methyltransferase RsmG n=1 Tax=Fodinibius sp. TaxID=1872440 RepID=UPI002ACE813F|nr:RsmG family class I SAM-dependent methyltransferase [Fodinibius sp.]MDZ7660356.1 RsmG family class I SAM-dependent methyltransferase [Fodinibius sp.]
MEQHHIIEKSVPRETFAQIDGLIKQFRNELESYLDKLLWWNDRVNLVSRGVPRETIWEHMRHSLLLSALQAFQENKLFIDAGTGGGLPGIPLAITHSDKHFVLNDLVTKKCLAMKQIARELDLKNIGIIDGSIEDLQHKEECILISKHAFKIGNLIEMTGHLSWKKMILYKGLDFEDELQGLSKPLTITCFDLSSGSDFYSGKAIIIIEKP